MVDLDHDGYDDEVILGTHKYIWAYTWNGSFNSIYNETQYIWRKDLGTSHPKYELISTDLNGDGLEDEIVTPSSGASGWGPALLLGLDNNSNTLWNYTIIKAGEGDDLINSLMTGDVNDDGIEEIIFGSNRFDKIFVIERNGSFVWSYGIGKGDIGNINGNHPGIDVSDINNDGIPDIAVASADGYLHILQSVTCTAKFNDSSTIYNLTWNNTLRKWQVNRTFSSPGTYSWNVTCQKGGYQTATASSTITIQEDTEPPHFSDAQSNATQSTDVIKLNITVTDNSGVVDTVIFGINGTNYTYSGHTGSEYYLYWNCSANPGYWVWNITWANDTAGNLNYTTESNLPISFTCNLLTCTNCSDCSDKIQNQAQPGYVVRLVSDIINATGTCIDFGDTDNITFDCQGHLIDGNESESSTTVGIDISHNSYNTIHNCRVREFRRGIVPSGFHNTLENNTIFNNMDRGIYTVDMSDALIINNTLYGNNIDVYLSWGSRNNFTNNNFTKTKPEETIFYFYWGLTSPNNYNHSIDTSNTINGKPIYYYSQGNLNPNLQCPSSEISDLDAGMIGIAFCPNLQIHNNTVSYGALYIMHSNSAQAYNNTVYQSAYGIFLRSSNNSQIYNNTIPNGYRGITLDSRYGEENASVYDNVIENVNRGIEIAHNSKMNDKIFSNTISAVSYGITSYFSGEGYLNISYNTISNFTQRGIWQDFGGNVTIVWNTLENAEGTGIYVYDSCNVSTHHNTIFNTSHTGIHFHTFQSCASEIFSNIVNYSGTDLWDSGITVGRYGTAYNNIIENSGTNTGVGLKLYSNSTAYNNTIINAYGGLGISDSVYNATSYNNTIQNTTYGIKINYKSRDNLVYSNILLNNQYGIYLYNNVTNNTIHSNRVENSSSYGIYLASGFSGSVYNNTIYNNLFNNTQNFYFSGTVEGNYWNTTLQQTRNIRDGPHIGGNYWAKPDGTGFSQTCNDTSPRDGICDEP
ncbi:hypothetical protein DRO24_02955 [Candidatus Bathyarchaeota archaeon]|nr:MAG: hypothetical protein DRO24_02955 [Candidatus Bathyarchaeota archaeon]